MNTLFISSNADNSPDCISAAGFLPDKNTRTRSVSLDFLRILSAFFVIFNHTNTAGFDLYTTITPGTPAFWICLFISVFCKFAVPVFFAISGALLLTRKEPLKDIFTKRILKHLLLLVVFSFLYYVGELIRKGNPFSLTYFLSELYSSELASSLWFMYAYLAFLICLPFLRAMVTSLPRSYFVYMIILVVIFKDIRTILDRVCFNNALTLNSNLRLDWLSSDIIIYPCIGYYLYNLRSPKGCGKMLLWLWPLNLVALILCCFLTYKKYQISGSYSQTYFSRFNILNCMAVFASVRYYFAKHSLPTWLRNLIHAVASCTLGVYLLHPFFLGKRIPVINKAWIALRSLPWLHPMVAAFIQCLCILLFCSILTWLFRQAIKHIKVRLLSRIQ